MNYYLASCAAVTILIVLLTGPRLLMLLNCAINPAIYALMKRDIRAEFMAMVGGAAAAAAETTDTTAKEDQAKSRHTAEPRRTQASDAV